MSLHLTSPQDRDLRQRWRTPRWLFECLGARWVPGGFTVDAAADAENALHHRFWTKERSGLLQSWRGERVWCNPPFDAIDPWVYKASQCEAEVAVLLLPVRTSTEWWPVAYRSAIAVDWIRGRVAFVPPPGLTAPGSGEHHAAFIFRAPLEATARRVAWEHTRDRTRALFD